MEFLCKINNVWQKWILQILFHLTPEELSFSLLWINVSNKMFIATHHFKLFTWNIKNCSNRGKTFHSKLKQSYTVYGMIVETCEYRKISLCLEGNGSISYINEHHKQK